MDDSIDISEIIKAYDAPPEEEFDQTSTKVKPFEFMAAVGQTKKDIIKEDPAIAKDYVAYVVNRGFGFFPDTVLYANEMNLYPGIPGVAQYYYYMASLRKQKRFSKWHKLVKNDNQELIQTTYNVRPEVAKQYMKLLSKEDLDTLRTLSETGEPKKNK